ncbi:MAG TPA: prolipoprotein diacylglyceryl transferase family protein, partial [Gemmatimonadales bacterium]|nr:prolipoprotein diacylglyceryl transferase family protein [Gemmatimonadales bacterium]
MTIYPFILHLGPLEITGYGIMMMVGFLMGGWLITLQLRERGLYEEYAADITVAAVVGGIIGAKVWYWAVNGGSLFSRGGLV